MSSLATSALTTASSVAWTTASKNGSRLPHGMNDNCCSHPGPGRSAPGVAAEKARNRSPEKCDPLAPVRASPAVTRRASAWHWCGNSGASVATTAMTEPAPGAKREAAIGAERPPGQYERVACAEVRLHEDAARVVGVGEGHQPRARP